MYDKFELVSIINITLSKYHEKPVNNVTRNIIIFIQFFADVSGKRSYKIN